MTFHSPRAVALAFSLAVLASSSALSVARADEPNGPSPTPSFNAPAHPTSAPTPSSMTSAAAPSLNEPAPTPSWAEAGPKDAAMARHPSGRRYAPGHYASRSGHRDYGDNPIRTVAMGMAGGAADLGSVAAYPFYCFPNYGSCSVRVPYRY